MTGEKMKENIAELLKTPDLWEMLATDNRPIAVYGMGNGADKLFEKLASIGRTPVAVFASDSFVRGQVFHGYRVQRFTEVKEKWPDCVVLMSFATRQPDVMADVFTMAEEIPFYLPDMPVAGNLYFDRYFVADNANALQCVYDMLADDLSCRLLLDVLRYKYTGDIRYLKNAYSSAEEEVECFRGRTVKIAIDGGAYTGDTAQKMITDFPDIQKIVAIEPDPKTYKKLLKNIANRQLSCIEPIHAALWQETGEACFKSSGNRNSTFSYASYQHNDVNTRLVTIDELAKNLHVDYIKLDIEGAEKEALMGARNTILRDRPILGVSLYHRTEDLCVLPRLLENMCRNYKFYLRRPPCLPAWELMLYAV